MHRRPAREIAIMIRICIRLPIELYREAKRIAAGQGISLAEVLRRRL